MLCSLLLAFLNPQLVALVNLIFFSEFSSKNKGLIFQQEIEYFGKKAL
jgi:hypothetical protein